MVLLKHFLGEFPEAIDTELAPLNGAYALPKVGSKIFAGWRILAGYKDSNIDYTNHRLSVDLDVKQTTDYVFEAVYVTGTRLTCCGSDYTQHRYQSYWVQDGLSRSVVELTENVRMSYPIIRIIFTQRVRFLLLK